MAVNISGIKTQFKSIMDTANDIDATYDLSTGLNKRVVKVFKINPLKIPITATKYPYVTIYMETKEIEQTNINTTFKIAKFGANLNMLVVGGVWETRFTNETEDNADEEIEKLMENIEEILRRNHTLNGTVKWCKFEGVEYHTIQLSEEVYLRCGVGKLKVRIDEY